MRKVSILTILYISLYSCADNSSKTEDKITSELIPTEDVGLDEWKEKFYLRSIHNTIDAQTGRPILDTIIQNAPFAYVINDSNKLMKLWTHESSFLTPEGYGVGTKWNEIDDSLKSRMYQLPGWGQYVELKSGWKLCFCTGQSCTDNLPTDSSEVFWVEKML